MKLDRYKTHDIEVVVDRLVIQSDVRPRVSQSVETALQRRCPHCGGPTQNKGQKGNQVESRVGGVQLERAYYYCPRCQQGFFPPG